MAVREHARFAGRTAMLAQRPGAGDLFWLERDDVWSRRQYPVIWIAPAGTGPTVLPPGMHRLPAPGQAVLSPALHRLALHDPAIAARYPHHAVLAPPGTRSRDELVAYVRPARGRSLARARAVARVRGFGATGGPAVTTASSALDGETLILGAVGFVVIPAALLGLAGVATASQVRDRRFAILSALGASRAVVTRLSVLETVMLALGGVVPICLTWALIGGRVAEVPIVGHDVYRGDLGLAPMTIAGIGALELCLCAVGAAMLTRSAAATITSPRPREAPQRAPAWRAVPLGIALGTIVGGAKGRQQRGGGHWQAEQRSEQPDEHEQTTA
jgi:hypothetical protein